MRDCEKCTNTRLIVSENGYFKVCTLSPQKARKCILTNGKYFVFVNRKEDK